MSKDDDKQEGAIAKRLLDARVILVSDQVSDKMARQVTAQALLMQHDSAKDPITVYINSPGGSADSGFAIYDVLKFLKPPVRTVVNGLCASAAILIGLSTPRERRFATPNSRFLIHQPSTAFFGSASDIAINAQEIVRLKAAYNAIVAEQTGRSVEQVGKDADRDFWLDAKQAKDYGLISRIVAHAGELE